MAEIFHTLSRGVDKRQIFMDNQDYFRFIHNLFEFNDEAPADTASYYFYKNNVIARPKIREGKPRKLLVNILAFCLMPNHYHLLLNAESKNNISKFMKKLNMGYARYFNERHKRTGALFESRYKSIIVKNDVHFIHLPFYIHSNPLDLKFPQWRNKGLKNHKRALKFLENYRWSSHLDYLGKKNFPSITQRDFLIDFFDDLERYRNSFIQWLKDLKIETIEDMILD